MSKPNMFQKASENRENQMQTTRKKLSVLYKADSKMIKTTISLREDEHRKLKILAAQKGTTFSQMIRNWIDSLE